jgi:hypothetical protein
MLLKSNCCNKTAPVFGLFYRGRRFLPCPSLKLKKPSRKGPSIENRLHGYLMDNFGGYTAQAGNIFGYWREDNGLDSYGEHREFSIAASDTAKLTHLKQTIIRKHSL